MRNKFMTIIQSVLIFAWVVIAWDIPMPPQIFYHKVWGGLVTLITLVPAIVMQDFKMPSQPSTLKKTRKQKTKEAV
jgi:hypothetical protein